jgi:N-acetylgalactosamine PTS system EIIB component
VITLVRVDNRLLHGQILEAWVPRLAIDQVIVADDEAAASDLAKAAMTLCVPPELPVRILALADVDFAAIARSRAKVLVLVRDPVGLARPASRPRSLRR